MLFLPFNDPSRGVNEVHFFCFVGFYNRRLFPVVVAGNLRGSAWHVGGGGGHTKGQEFILLKNLYG